MAGASVPHQAATGNAATAYSRYFTLFFWYILDRGAAGLTFTDPSLITVLRMRLPWDRPEVKTQLLTWTTDTRTTCISC